MFRVEDSPSDSFFMRAKLDGGKLVAAVGI
jgi:hypothetical protein